jgi:LysM repeat protein
VQDETPAIPTERDHDPVAGDATGGLTVPVAPAMGQAPDAEPSAFCPFLRSVDGRDALGPPIGSPDPGNRCAALRDVVPQSLRQQELVCLTSAHVNCPRFMRGSPEPVEVVEPVATISLSTPAIAGSVAILLVAFMISVVFMVNNGGLVLTAAAPSSQPTGVVLGDVEPASPRPAATADLATASPTTAPSTSPSPTPAPTSAASPSPSPSLTPTDTPKPARTPSSDRYDLLKPCPDKSDCYIYVIRSGDNLFSIARYFGVPLATVKSMNPWTANGLRAGRELRIPPPTR